MKSKVGIMMKNRTFNIKLNIKLNKKFNEVFYVAPFLAFFIISCHRGPQDNPPPPPAPPAKNEPVSMPPSTCDILKSTFTASPSLIVRPLKTRSIERHFQRVIRHDCSGNLKSDKIETVLPPHLNFVLKNLSQKPFKGVLVFNEETCNHVLSTMPLINWPLLGLLYSVTGDGKSQISIKGDLAPATLTFQLAKGMNHIFVRYYHDCLPSTIEGHKINALETPQCPDSQDYTTVEYPIEITYSQKTLEGFLTRDDSEESCAQEEARKKGAL